MKSIAAIVVWVLLLAAPSHGQDCTTRLTKVQNAVSLIVRQKLESSVNDRVQEIFHPVVGADGSSRCSTSTPASSLPLNQLDGVPDSVSGQARCALYCQNLDGCKSFNYFRKALTDGTQCQLFTAPATADKADANCQYYEVTEQQLCSKPATGPPQVYPSSCKTIKAANSNAPSGEYTIQTSSQRLIKVYCEMGLSGGGYTFLRPFDLPSLTDAEVQAIFTDKQSFLMRISRTDTYQPYAELRQMKQYSATPLVVYLNRNPEYSTPRNVNQLGSNYLYFGFLPISATNQRNVQGLQVNGVDISFTSCDANPNSYFALFPNFSEAKPVVLLPGINWPMFNTILSNMQINPSRRVMPAEYFTFFEGLFGGCGLFTQSDSRLDELHITTASIGFR